MMPEFVYKLPPVIFAIYVFVPLLSGRSEQLPFNAELAFSLFITLVVRSFARQSKAKSRRDFEGVAIVVQLILIVNIIFAGIFLYLNLKSYNSLRDFYTFPVYYLALLFTPSLYIAAKLLSSPAYFAAMFIFTILLFYFFDRLPSTSIPYIRLFYYFVVWFLVKASENNENNRLNR